MDCTFHPMLAPRRKFSAPSAPTRPTKSSILREVAIYEHQEELKRKGEPLLNACPSMITSSSIASLSSTRSPSHASIAKSLQATLEDFRNAEAEAAYQNQQRHSEVLLSFRAGSEVRALSALKK